MTVHLPTRAGERYVVTSAPGNDCPVRGSESTIVAPMRRRRHAATRRHAVKHTTCGGEGRRYANAELDVDVAGRSLNITIDEDVLSVELHSAGAACRVNLIELCTKKCPNAGSGNACVNRSHAPWRGLLKLDVIDIGRLHHSLGFSHIFASRTRAIPIE
jgi:hypothetical protein